MKTPIWPYIAVVACLFALSLLAPRAWLSSESPPPLPLTLGNSSAQSATPTMLRPHQEHESSVQDSVRKEIEVRHLTSVTESLATHLDEGPEDLNALFNVECPAHVATIQPPVGQQVEMDVPVAETPAAAPVAETPALPVSQPAPSGQPSSVEPVVIDAPAAEPEAQVGVEKQDSTMPEVAGVIPRPVAIIEALYELRAEPVCGEWAEQIASLLNRIHQMPTLTDPEIPELLQQLYRQLKESPQLAGRATSLNLRARILRIGYATKRRVDVWHQVNRVLSQKEIPLPDSASDMQERLAAVEKRLKVVEFAEEWSKYLLLSDVHEVLGPGDTDARREVAKRILRRIESPQLSPEQIAVFQASPFAEFVLELRRWSSEPVDYLRLLDQIEEYEGTGSTESATAIAACYDVVRWSSQPELHKLGEILNTHYRNANVRVALTSDFLNRLLPDPQAYQQSINNTIAGADVYGTSETVNRLQVVLHPDSENWRIGLEAIGEVASDTAASKGPATFYNQGYSRYHARKLLMIDRRGIRVWRAEADANSETELKGFETDFDPIPILGWLARSVARSQHDQQYYNAKAETEEMVRNEASSRFDEQVHERLAAAEQKVKQKLLRPFEKIELKPTPLDMSTTEQRVIARYRLAADRQLGAQTPRPQAPSDSLLSVQLHESALNNTLANLKLEGKRIGLHELYKQLAEIFERPELEAPEDIPDTVIVQFADEEAIRVRCDDGKLMVTMRFTELKDGRFKRKDFAVRAFYVPASDQLNANLVREGAVQIIGDRLRFGEPLALRTVFSKVLSENRPFNLINKRLSEDTHLTDCHVNQFVINDGWIGVGIGPNRADQVDDLARERNSEQQR